MKLAPGAERILNLRRAGQRPESDVIVSTVGQLPVEWTVEADLDTDYDWIWAVGLNVWIVANTRTSKAKLRRLIWAFKEHRPNRLHLWLDDTNAGYQLHFWPTLESIVHPPDKWEWRIERASLLKWENEVMRQIFQGVTA